MMSDIKLYSVIEHGHPSAKLLLDSKISFFFLNNRQIDEISRQKPKMIRKEEENISISALKWKVGLIDRVRILKS